jgi:hypothetical protein
MNSVGSVDMLLLKNSQPMVSNQQLVKLFWQLMLHIQDDSNQMQLSQANRLKRTLSVKNYTSLKIKNEGNTEDCLVIKMIVSLMGWQPLLVIILLIFCKIITIKIIWKKQGKMKITT